MNWRSFCEYLKAKIYKLTKKVDNLPVPTEIVANPTLAGTESDLSGLQVGDTKYKVPAPTEVIANPTLAGTESDLSGLQVGDTKYKVPSGGQLYYHFIKMTKNSPTDVVGFRSAEIFISIISTKAEAYTSLEFWNYAITKYTNESRIPCIQRYLFDHYTSNVVDAKAFPVSIYPSSTQEMYSVTFFGLMNDGSLTTFNPSWLSNATGYTFSDSVKAL